MIDISVNLSLSVANITGDCDHEEFCEQTYRTIWRHAG